MDISSLVGGGASNRNTKQKVADKANGKTGKSKKVVPREAASGSEETATQVS